MFPNNTHPPILYPMARLKDGNTAAAGAFATFLASPQARAIFDRHGFGPPKNRQ